MDRQWYFACTCGVKFFAHASRTACPRCGKQLRSPGKETVPWQKKEQK